MIHTNRTVTVGNQESIIDSPIILYRGDREVEVEFTLNGNKFTFTNGGNVIKSTNATHGQLVINTPTGENMFSEVTECNEGKVIFLITKEMIDELVEIGFYSFQIRLFDESQVSRVTIPPVFQGIDIRNPIAAEDETNVVDIGLVDYAVVQKDEYENLATFLPDGSYNKTDWESKGLITEAKLDKIEDALYTINENMEASDLSIFNRLESINRNVNRQITEFRDEADAEIEAFERSVNTNVEQFKIDTNAVMTAHKNEVSEVVDGFDAQLTQNTNDINDISVNIKRYESFNEGSEYWDEAIKEALKTNNNVFFPEGTYKFKNHITIPSYKNIKGVNTNLGTGVKFIFENDGFLIPIDARYITIENIQIFGNKKGAGIRYGNESSSNRGTFHFVRIENVQIYGFYEGISLSSNIDSSTNESILWNCFFNNMRVEHCERGLYCYDNPYPHFGIVFDCVYFNACNQVLYVYSLQSDFRNCNFGITNTNSFNVRGNSSISFSNCNFECDTFISTKGNLFNAVSKNIDFKNNIFISRCSSDTSFFGVYSTLEQLSFSNCVYKKHNEDLMSLFFSKSDCETARMGVVEFFGGTVSIPRPQWTGIYASRYKDKMRDKMISYDLANNTNKDHSLASMGEYAFNPSNSLPIIHNGTEITDFLGNTLGNDSGVYRLSNNLYMETGRIDIPAGSGLITVRYKRPRKGIFITSPTGFIDGTRIKYMISIEQSTTYFDKDGYCVLRAYQWDETSKTWSTTITTSFVIDYIKISN